MAEKEGIYQVAVYVYTNKEAVKLFIRLEYYFRCLFLNVCILNYKYWLELKITGLLCNL